MLFVSVAKDAIRDFTYGKAVDSLWIAVPVPRTRWQPCGQAVNKPWTVTLVRSLVRETCRRLRIERLDEMAGKVGLIVASGSPVAKDS
jgi:hypothetical protein